MKLELIKPAFAIIKNPVVDPTGTQTVNPAGFFNNTLQAIVSILLIVAVIYFLWHFVLGGFDFISSNGDSKKIEEARSQIFNALIGLAIAFSVFAVLKLLGTIFGIPSLSNLFFALPTL